LVNDCRWRTWSPLWKQLTWPSLSSFIFHGWVPGRQLALIVYSCRSTSQDLNRFPDQLLARVQKPKKLNMPSAHTGCRQPSSGRLAGWPRSPMSRFALRTGAVWFWLWVWVWFWLWLDPKQFSSSPVCG